MSLKGEQLGHLVAQRFYWPLSLSNGHNDEVPFSPSAVIKVLIAAALDHPPHGSVTVEVPQLFVWFIDMNVTSH